MRPFLLLFNLLLISACITPEPEIVDETRQKQPVSGEFTIKYGETITFPDNPLQVMFSEVLEESRCPSEVVCVSAGRAVIEVLFIESDTVEIVELTKSEDHPDLAFGTASGYQLELLAVNPYPTTEIPEDFDDYVIVLKFE